MEGRCSQPPGRSVEMKYCRARSIGAQAPGSGAAAAQLRPIGSGRGSTYGNPQHLRSFGLDRVDVGRHPCASKRASVVRFAPREQRQGRAAPRAQTVS